MQSTAVLTLRDAHTAAAREATSPEAALATLPAVFAAVPDPRSRHGQRDDLPFLLTCLVAALLRGCDALDAVGQWTHDRRARLARHFGARRRLTPTGSLYSLYRRLLPRRAAAHLEAALAAWARQTRPRRDREPVALADTVVRGAVTLTQPAPHLLSVSTHDTGETLLHMRVDDKTNEIPSAPAVLPPLPLPLRGRVVTADALHPQTATAQAVLDQQAAYLLVVKDNQPRLPADLEASCADPRATARSATTTDRAHGRVETRTLHVTPRLCAYLARYGAVWPLPAHRPGRSPRAHRAHRAHRAREGPDQRRNGLPHHPPDAPPRRRRPPAGPDPRPLERGGAPAHPRRHLRRGRRAPALRPAPQVLAALRNRALTLIRRAGHTAIASYRRPRAAHPAKALRLLRPKTHSRR